MGAQGFQYALTELITNRACRKAFFDGDSAGLLHFELTADELRLLRELKQNTRGIEVFSSVLCKKRLAAVRHLMPLTYRTIGDDGFKQAWLTYWNLDPLAGHLAAENDADRFGDSLCACLPRGGVTPGPLRDIIAYEALKNRIASSARPVPVEPRAHEKAVLDLYPIATSPVETCSFSHDISEIIGLLNQCEGLDGVKPKPCTLLFYRDLNTGRVSTAKANAALLRFLDHCSGSVTLRALTRMIYGVSGSDSRRHLVWIEEFCTTLLQIGLLRFAETADGEART